MHCILRHGGSIMHTGILGLAIAMVMLTGVYEAQAKRCRRVCRDQVVACVADARARIVCTELVGTERRDCRRALHTAIRTCRSARGPILAACKASASVDTCSPSGAFLDAGHPGER
jgi:hypothetical protein